MAASPKYKIFNPDGQYVASVKDLTLAAPLLDLLGTGSTLRTRRPNRILWREGPSPTFDGYANDNIHRFIDSVAPREATREAVTT